MSDSAQGPGWWRASDGRWYPPQQHPSYQSPPPPAPPPPPPGYATGGYPPAVASPPAAPPREPAHRTLTATTWLLGLGALGAFVSVFLTWATATVDDGFGDVATGTASLSGVAKFIGIAIAIGIVALTAPTFAGGTISRKRLVGLVVVLAIFTVLAGAWTANSGNSLKGASKEMPDVGVFVCWTAIVLMWIATVQVWRQGRRQATSPSARGY